MDDVSQPQQPHQLSHEPEQLPMQPGPHDAPHDERGGPQVAIIMGSDSDWPVMQQASAALDEFGIAHEVEVVSAHRTPQKMIEFGMQAAARGIRVIIAGAGGAAHLPGMVASVTTLPVIGVPVPLAKLDGLDSLLSIVQMPAGIPVATVSIGGARNAGLLAARMLGMTDAALQQRLADYAAGLEQLVDEKNAALQQSLGRAEAGAGAASASGATVTPSAQGQ